MKATSKTGPHAEHISEECVSTSQDNVDKDEVERDNPRFEKTSKLGLNERHESDHIMLPADNPESSDARESCWRQTICGGRRSLNFDKVR